jgi:hypothetical protein
MPEPQYTGNDPPPFLEKALAVLVLGTLVAILLYALATPDPCFYGPGC